MAPHVHTYLDKAVHHAPGLRFFYIQHAVSIVLLPDMQGLACVSNWIVIKIQSQDGFLPYIAT